MNCPDCGIPLIRVLWGSGKPRRDGKDIPQQEVYVDPAPRTFFPLAEGRQRVQDGDPCFTSGAMVEHRTLCPKRPMPEMTPKQRALEAERLAREPQPGVKVTT